LFPALREALTSLRSPGSKASIENLAAGAVSLRDDEVVSLTERFG